MAESMSALDALRAMFQQYNMGDLADVVWNIQQEQLPEGEAIIKIRGTDAYKRHFPGMDKINASGMAINEADYIRYKQRASEYESYYGLPNGMLADRTGDLLVNNVSTDELRERLDLNREAALSAPAEIKTALQNMYGVSIGDLTAYYLDPETTMQRLQSGIVAGAGIAAGFSADQRQAERLLAMGVDSWAEAQQGYQQAAGMRNLTGGYGERLTQDQTVNAAFGMDQASSEEARRIGQGRAAQFQGGGGGYAGSQAGVGLGSAAT